MLVLSDLQQGRNLSGLSCAPLLLWLYARRDRVTCAVASNSSAETGRSTPLYSTPALLSRRHRNHIEIENSFAGQLLTHTRDLCLEGSVAFCLGKGERERERVSIGVVIVMASSYRECSSAATACRSAGEAPAATVWGSARKTTNYRYVRQQDPSRVNNDDAAPRDVTEGHHAGVSLRSCGDMRESLSSRSSCQALASECRRSVSPSVSPAAAAAAMASPAVSKSNRTQTSRPSFATHKARWCSAGPSHLLIALVFLVWLSIVDSLQLISVSECSGHARPNASSEAEMVRFLTERQRELLVNATIVSPSVFSAGERCAITACQKWMRGTRWGCHLQRDRYPYFGKVPPPRKLTGEFITSLNTFLHFLAIMDSLSLSPAGGSGNMYLAFVTHLEGEE